MRYTPGLKDCMIRKMVGPDAVSATDLARDVGIHQTTLSRWLRDAGDAASVAACAQGEPDNATPRRPKDWTPEEKWKAVVEAESLTEEQLGGFLRRKGLHEAQTREWRAQTLSGLHARPTPCLAKGSPEVRRVRELEKELDRKEKALAEAAALLVLQKKVRVLWEVADNPTARRSGK